MTQTSAALNTAATRRITRVKGTPRYSKAVATDGTLYIAGQIADDTEADISGQAEQVICRTAA